MTENQKKLEELLLNQIEMESKAVCGTNNIPQTAMALIELWKVTERQDRSKKKMLEKTQKNMDEVEFEEIVLEQRCGASAEYLRAIVEEIKKSKISYKKFRLKI